MKRNFVYPSILNSNWDLGTSFIVQYLFRPLCILTLLRMSVASLIDALVFKSELCLIRFTQRATFVITFHELE